MRYRVLNVPQARIFTHFIAIRIVTAVHKSSSIAPYYDECSEGIITRTEKCNTDGSFTFSTRCLLYDAWVCVSFTCDESYQFLLRIAFQINRILLANQMKEMR